MREVTSKLRDAAIARVLTGAGRTSSEARRAAFENAGVDERARALIDKVASNAWKVTDEDVAAVKASGLSEDEIFELVVAAAFGQASRQLQSAMAALDTAAGRHEGEHR